MQTGCFVYIVIEIHADKFYTLDALNLIIYPKPPQKTCQKHPKGDMQILASARKNLPPPFGSTSTQNLEIIQYKIKSLILLIDDKQSIPHINYKQTLSYMVCVYYQMEVNPHQGQDNDSCVVHSIQFANFSLNNWKQFQSDF